MEEKLIAVNRTLVTINSCIHAMVYAKSEQELLDEICRIIVKEGAYSLAWIGYAEKDDRKTVQPVASAGEKHWCVEKISVTWANDALGRGPAGIAIRTGAITVFNHIETDPRFIPWLKTAREFGLRSVIGLPLIVSGETIGTLVIYSSESNIFDREEIELLERLAQDLSYGVRSIRAEKERRQAERGLRFLGKVLDTTTIGVTITDLEGNIIYTNPADASMHGYTVEELIGKKANIFAPPEFRNNLEVGEILKWKNRKRESVNITRDGYCFPVYLMSDIVENAEGEPAGFVTTCEDISDRKKAEEALRESEEKYRKLVETSGDAIFITEAQTGIILDVNRRAEELIGRTKEQLIGKHQLSLYPKREGKVYSRLLKEVAGSGRKFVEDVCLEHADGNSIAVNVRAGDAELAGKKIIQWIFRDITERKKVEANLRKLSQAVMQSPASIIISDVKGNIEYVNPKFTEVTGYSYEDVIGRNPRILNSGKQSSTFYNKMWKTLMEGNEWRGELQNKKKDGELFWVYASVSPIVDEGGVITHFLAVEEDITARKKGEEDIKKSREQLRSLALHIENVREEERKKIARDIHDDLGQLLTVLKFDLSWIEKELGEGKDALIDKTRQASKLVDDSIEAVQRISSELRPAILDDLGIAAGIEWLVKKFENRTNMECDFFIKPPDINLDNRLSTEIFRIVQEALTNAARHSGAKRVGVSLTRSGRRLTLKIRDNGKGITEEEISDPCSFGLMGLRERIIPWGGRVQIKGTKRIGTLITVIVPIEKTDLEARNEKLIRK